MLVSHLWPGGLARSYRLVRIKLVGSKYIRRAKPEILGVPTSGDLIMAVSMSLQWTPFQQQVLHSVAYASQCGTLCHLLCTTISLSLNKFGWRLISLDSHEHLRLQMAELPNTYLLNKRRSMYFISTGLLKLSRFLSHRRMNDNWSYIHKFTHLIASCILSGSLRPLRRRRGPYILPLIWTFFCHAPI